MHAQIQNYFPVELGPRDLIFVFRGGGVEVGSEAFFVKKNKQKNKTKQKTNTKQIKTHTRKKKQ